MLKIYNTLSKEKNSFVSINAGKINIFVCGPTVYDYPHLGHAKTYIQFDFIVKYLRFIGYDVFYLQNITDIDNKIIDRAYSLGISWKALSQKFELIYKEDMLLLGNNSVSEYARATDFIDKIVDQIQSLLKKGYAYHTIDGIYFEVSKFKEYGKLSGRTSVKENDAVSRIDESSFKKGWNDFCLWKAKKPNEPFWETEIGPGRPGWHIEDTAITESYFGPQYDIHGGAIDLVCPHHECEIAQMEAASGKVPLVKFWLHTGFLNLNEQKMSKSSGNFKTVRDILKIYDFRVIRYFVLSSHYRTTIDFSEEGLLHAKNTLERIRNFLFNIDKQNDDYEREVDVFETKNRILEALDNDFNTPEACSHIHEFMNNSSKYINGKRVFELFQELNKIFGDIFTLPDSTVSEKEIVDLIRQREVARQHKDFKKSDEIRDSLKTKGIELYDTKEGIKWRQV